MLPGLFSSWFDTGRLERVMNRRTSARSLGGVDDLRDLLRVGGGRRVARAYLPDLPAETLGHPPLRLRCTIR